MSFAVPDSEFCLILRLRAATASMVPADGTGRETGSAWCRGDDECPVRSFTPIASESRDAGRACLLLQ
jgi:hypothetical protein